MDYASTSMSRYGKDSHIEDRENNIFPTTLEPFFKEEI